MNRQETGVPSAVRRYRHTQTGTSLLWILGGATVLVAGLGLREEEGRWVSVLVIGIAVLMMVLFASLTVEVTDRELRLAFGPGVIRRRYPLADVLAARAVTNPWYYGLGIHRTPDGWLFNVAGSEAVELELRGNRKVRVGTDEPERLLAAIRAAAPPSSL